MDARHVVLAFFEARNGHDLDRMMDLVSEDVVNHAPTGVPGPPGKDGVRQAMAMEIEAFPDHHVDVQEVVAEGERVAVLGQSSGTQLGSFAGVPPSTRRFDVRVFQLVRVRSGQIVEHWGCSTGSLWRNSSGCCRRSRASVRVPGCFPAPAQLRTPAGGRRRWLGATTSSVRTPVGSSAAGIRARFTTPRATTTRWQGRSPGPGGPYARREGVPDWHPEFIVRQATDRQTTADSKSASTSRWTAVGPGARSSRQPRPMTCARTTRRSAPADLRRHAHRAAQYTSRTHQRVYGMCTREVQSGSSGHSSAGTPVGKPHLTWANA